MSEKRCSSRDDESREWFAEWFNHPLYLKVYHHRDRTEAALCVDTILRITGLGSDPLSKNVLDIACGAGRHAIEFARLGFRVTANDLSPYLLSEAVKDAHGQAEKMHIHFTENDMRHFSSESPFHLVVQLFSSFGYFDHEEDDRKVINNVSGVLLPGGWYVLDLINPHYLRLNFRDRTERKVEEMNILEERTLGLNSVRKTLTISTPESDPVSFTESVRLYDLPEISAILKAEGLDVVYVAGDYTGNPYDAECSTRLMLFARKR